jgi:aromatic-L-amino-acid decarboxylase
LRSARRGSVRSSAAAATPAADGIDRPVALYATTETHHTIQRAAGVLGIGRRAVRAVACDRPRPMRVDALAEALAADRRAGVLPIAVVGNAGTTNTGAIDPLQAIGELAAASGIWFHVDGAYGLPGILDERVAPALRRPRARRLGDRRSALVARRGGRRRRDLRARPRAAAPRLHAGAGGVPRSSMASPAAGPVLPEHSMDDFGVPYYDYGVELSAPSRGVVVWSLLREIGGEGIAARVRRHNDMTRWIAAEARAHPRLELLLEPTLSICLLPLRRPRRRRSRRLQRAAASPPGRTRTATCRARPASTVGSRSGRVSSARAARLGHAEALVADVLRIGAALERETARGGSQVGSYSPSLTA